MIYDTNIRKTIGCGLKMVYGKGFNVNKQPDCLGCFGTIQSLLENLSVLFKQTLILSIEFTLFTEYYELNVKKHNCFSGV